MTKNEALNIQILNLIAGGMQPVDAARQVLGSAAVDQMIDDIYTALRAKGGR